MRSLFASSVISYAKAPFHMHSTSIIIVAVPCCFWSAFHRIIVECRISNFAAFFYETVNETQHIYRPPYRTHGTRRRAGTGGISGPDKHLPRYHLHGYERPVYHRWFDGDAGSSADLTIGGHGRGLARNKGDQIV